eukprot:3385885-Rhodomonas_salina.3
MSGTELWRMVVLSKGVSDLHCYGAYPEFRYHACYRPTVCYATGTDIGYAAICYSTCYAISVLPDRLRCYHICYTICYAAAGTDVGYGANRSTRAVVRLKVEYAEVSAKVCSYALLPTHLLHAVRYCPTNLLLRLRAMVLRDARICCYAMSGTELARMVWQWTVKDGELIFRCLPPNQTHFPAVSVQFVPEMQLI